MHRSPTSERIRCNHGKKKQVCCLYRVLTKGQVEKDDIPMQKQRCCEFAESQGVDGPCGKGNLRLQSGCR